jgi:hypothetical protein
MSDITPEQLAAAVRRAATTLAADPRCKPYAPEAVGTVLKRVIINLAGAGSHERFVERLVDDPTLGELPNSVVDALVAPVLEHFAAATEEQVRR